MIIKQEDGLTFELCKDDFTARVINSPEAKGDIYIPRAVTHDSSKYIITRINLCSFKNNQNIKTIRFSDNSELRSIDKGAFYNSSLQSIVIPNHVTYIGEHAFFLCYKLKTIKFADNCELRSIDKDVFTRSSLESITFPASVEELKEGWCCGTPKLNQITISQKNVHFSYADKEGRMIVQKSSLSDGAYDDLVFAPRDMKNIVVPSSIKKISSFAFDECQHLKTIEFSEDSELRSICKYAFFLSTVEMISFPKKLDQLNEGWCVGTPKLTRVSISSENKRYRLFEDKLVVGKSVIECDKYDVLVFACRDIKKAIIPSSIKKISSYAFDECQHLKTVEFSEDSELLSIEEGAFACTSLERITIPRHVKYIGEEAFSECKHLKSIEFSEDSELKTINSKAFIGSSLETMTIPSSVEELGEFWCSCTSMLTHVSISPKNRRFSFIDDEKKIVAFNSKSGCENEVVISFAERDVEKVIIPPQVKRIGPFSFSRCMNLKTVEFIENSQLHSIDERAFSGSSLKFISIPKNVNKIGDFAFCGCNNLQKISFDENSLLDSINEGAFSWSSLKRISIPKTVKKISNATFISCKVLETVELLGDDLFFGQKCFDKCQSLLVVSLPNAKKVSISILAISGVSNEFSLFINASTEIYLFPPLST